MAAGATVALWGMSTYAGYINSAMLAVLIVLACGPLVEWLRRRSLPNWATLVVTLFVAATALAIFFLFLIFATAQFVQSLPTYQEQAQAMVQQVQARLVAMGLDPAGSTAVANQADPSAALDLIKNFLAALAGTLGSFVHTRLADGLPLCGRHLVPGPAGLAGCARQHLCPAGGGFHRQPAPVYCGHGGHGHGDRRAQLNPVLPAGGAHAALVGRALRHPELHPLHWLLDSG